MLLCDVIDIQKVGGVGAALLSVGATKLRQMAPGDRGWFPPSLVFWGMLGIPDVAEQAQAHDARRRIANRAEQ